MVGAPHLVEVDRGWVVTAAAHIRVTSRAQDHWMQRVLPASVRELT